MSRCATRYTARILGPWFAANHQQRTLRRSSNAPVRTGKQTHRDYADRTALRQNQRVHRHFWLNHETNASRLCRQRNLATRPTNTSACLLEPRHKRIEIMPSYLATRPTHKAYRRKPKPIVTFVDFQIFKLCQLDLRYCDGCDVRGIAAVGPLSSTYRCTTASSAVKRIAVQLWMRRSAACVLTEVIRLS